MRPAAFTLSARFCSVWSFSCLAGMNWQQLRCLSFCSSPFWSRIRIINTLECSNHEAKHRTKVIDIFRSFCTYAVFAHLRHIASSKWCYTKYLTINHLTLVAISKSNHNLLNTYHCPYSSQQFICIPSHHLSNLCKETSI